VSVGQSVTTEVAFLVPLLIWGACQSVLLVLQHLQQRFRDKRPVLLNTFTEVQKRENRALYHPMLNFALSKTLNPGKP